MKQSLMEKFKKELLEISYLGSAVAVLHWDQEVNMPEKGNDLRAKIIGNLVGELHDKFTSSNFEKLLLELNKKFDAGKLNDEDSCIVRETWREFSREKKLPLNFVKDLAETTSKAQMIWSQARVKNDFKLFLPELKKIVELKRKEAKLIGYKGSPYNALLDTYEPYMGVEEIEMIFSELKDFLIPFLAKIKKSKVKINSSILKGNFPIEKQIEFNKSVAGKLGFDFGSGRLDKSTHPFSIGFNPQDVRITTRYKKDDLLYSVNSTIHETGHALYEQGIPTEGFGTPLGESISLGIHESQSRMWENILGKSEIFWQYFYPKLQKEFPGQFGKIKFEHFYQAINTVKSSLIRTEADEVTYNLHIILRFEIEKDLIEGSIAVEDLPQIWNDKFREYFGIKVPSDAMGALQDVHWSGGMIGYFPTYTLGNLYSAQFYETAKRDILNLEKEIKKGHFEHLLNWLRKNIHIHGKLFSAEELVEKVTGEKLTSKYFIDYLEKKYSEIYKLK
ncbi:MAG: carboxypeptidase Taq [Candidatus Moranbacteria bacterium GW2011_GWE1_35_17]|nr:MAG: carboxypeptidase Taq [Candidatus Moranbacteria bacterium GW2011_GWE1_35_17]KKP82929.1 MAG: carboxypeptidase Taq [Candidatus Moranbacteria bacterium GW2011_GWF1_35_5]KKP83298.1 MAG: carboxypeptidase Taq [Candidatus Moranbacteria bacterium GW2011_GWF2_35_54]